MAQRGKLAQEILIDILLRLPSKYLVRSICVSKQWRSLIQDHAKTARRPKILVYKAHLKSSLQSIDQQYRVESVRRPWKKMLPLLADIAIMGSCNGLLLLRIESDLFLWNPLTRCSKKVLAYHRLGVAGYDVVSGLCFHSSRNEYKAVMVLAHESPDYGSEFMVIGSFQSKLWTHVQFPYSVRTVKPGPVLNEHLHWLASKESWGHFLSTNQIVSFDPRSDKFKKVPMPQPKDEDGDGDIILGLGALDRCLCMTRFDNPRNFEGNVEVLAMREYGMKSSWTVMFTISNLAGVFCSYHWFVPLCSTKNNEVIMNLCIGVDEGYVTAYNPNDNSNRDILMATDNHDLNAIMYEESLVTPPDYNWEEEELRGEATYFEKYLSGSVGKRKRTRNGFWRYSRA
ncbi:F-box/kelch-repeat protein At3g23880-like [Camellia sinensis]|uniref:F-box/kelch-repeat protein At3g23880-like n=1 Tax=Camellia sinensis TaxID=4442 RepID=UPI001035CE6C|nr:F-box/kelch-repeat protein At3g23880-like [Camellia sinensis]